MRTLKILHFSFVIDGKHRTCVEIKGYLDGAKSPIYQSGLLDSGAAQNHFANFIIQTERFSYAKF